MRHAAVAPGRRTGVGDVGGAEDAPAHDLATSSGGRAQCQVDVREAGWGGHIVAHTALGQLDLWHTQTRAHPKFTYIYSTIAYI